MDTNFPYINNPNPSSTVVPKMLDRTKEPRPLLVYGHTDMSGVVFIDNNTTRPAVIVMPGGYFKAGILYRNQTRDHALDTDPGLGETFDGKFLPTLDISFSHHDFARAFVVGMGTVHINIATVNAETGVLLVAQNDGTYGEGSSVEINMISGHRFGVLATGQKNLIVDIKDSNAALYNNDPPGHTFYANESTKGAEYLRVKACQVRIGKSRATAKDQVVRWGHETAKFKGTWGVDYECLDDENPCGAFDQYGASGIARIHWIHPGAKVGQDAQNALHVAFRIGQDGHFGEVKGKFCLMGFFDGSLAPDQTVPAFRWETKYAAAAEVYGFGGSAPSVYGVADTLGLTWK